MPQETRYTTRYATPDTLQRATATTVELPLYASGALVAPTSGTLSLFDQNGTAVLDEVAITVTNSIAVYDIGTGVIASTIELSEAWRQKWTLLVVGETHENWRDCAIVRHRIAPVITDLDLMRRHSELRQWLAEDQSSAQDPLDEAWELIVSRLWTAGRRPYLILSNWSLREVHLYETLAIVFRDYWQSAGSGKYKELSEWYEGKAESAWASLTFRYDYDEDDVLDEGAEEGVGVPTGPVMLGGPGFGVP